MDEPVKMGLREMWSMRMFRTQVYLAVEITLIVGVSAYYAAEARRAPVEQSVQAPMKSNLYMEAKR